jgi:hypothetical protein
MVIIVLVSGFRPVLEILGSGVICIRSGIIDAFNLIADVGICKIVDILKGMIRRCLFTTIN